MNSERIAKNANRFTTIKTINFRMLNKILKNHFQ